VRAAGIESEAIEDGQQYRSWIHVISFNGLSAAQTIATEGRIYAGRRSVSIRKTG